MEKKGQMTMTKLGLLLLGLTIIWILCSRAQLQLPQRFEDQTITRLGGNPNFDTQKLNLAIKIKNNLTRSQVQNSTNQIDSLLFKTYGWQKLQQQTICIVVRDFQKQSTSNPNSQLEYLTVKSIINLKYEKYHVIYLSEKQQSSLQNIESYFIRNQIPDSKYSFVKAKTDTIASLFLASQKCPENGIIVILQDREYFTSHNSLKVINYFYSSTTKSADFTWASSLYSNDKLGLSVELSEKIKSEKQFRKYPYAANDVVTFKNSLLLKNKAQFLEHHLINPLWMTQSYGWPLMEKAQHPFYIPEILTIKNRKFKTRSQRTKLEKDIQELIRKDESILPILQNLQQYQGQSD